ASIPNLPDGKSVEVFSAMRKSPRLDSVFTGWPAKTVTEFHATNDRHIFDNGGHEAGGLPVLKGDAFDIWNNEINEIFTYGDKNKIENALQSKRLNQINSRKTAMYGLPLDWAKNLE